MRTLEAVPGLEAARSAGVFRPVLLGEEDLGIRLEIGWVLADSIRTLLALRLEGPEEPVQVTRAWLTDDQGGAHPLLEALELSPAGAARAGAPDHRQVLVFGALPPQAGRIRLEVHRVETAVPGLVSCPWAMDPWQAVEEELALHLMAWEPLLGPHLTVPLGTVEGCWALEMDHSSAPAWEASTSLDLDELRILGTARVRLLRLEGGLTGWRLASQVEGPAPPPPAEVQLEWLRASASARALAARLEEEGLAPLEDPPGLRLALRAAGEIHRSESGSGPWGPLGDRFYDFFPPTPVPPDALLVDQLLGLPLEEPWAWEFHPKLFDAPRTRVVFPHGPFPFEAEFWGDGLFWEEAFVLLAPQVAVKPGPVAEVRAARCRVLDMDGEVHECQGQAWVTHPREGCQVYGLQFPPLHRLMERARLEVESVDLWLEPALVLPLGEG